MITCQNCNDPYLNNPYASLKAPGSQITHQGKLYTKLSYELKINTATRLIKIIQFIAAVIFSCFIALAFQSMRKLWGEAIKGARSVDVLMPQVSLECTDIWMGIASNLSVRDLLVMRATSSHKQNIAEMTLINRLNAGDITPDALRISTVTRLIDFFGENCSRITNLNLQKFHHISDSDMKTSKRFKKLNQLLFNKRMKDEERFAFKWSLASSPEEIRATHIYNPENIFRHSLDQYAESLFRTGGFLIHTVAQFSLKNPGILTIYSGARSNWEPLHDKLLQEFNPRASSCKDAMTCQIKDVQFKDLKRFFDIVKEEPRLMFVDEKTMVAFAEFQKPPLSERLKAIKFDTETLPMKFFDNIVTMDIMDDPVEARIDKPFSMSDFLPEGGIRGANVYDRKTFEGLNGICPLSRLPLEAKPIPLSCLKFELLEIVEEAEAAYFKR